MPLVTFKTPIDRFRGTMRDESGTGLTIYDSPKSGNVARAYVRPYNPNSVLQQTVREAFGTAAKGFAALTALAAAAWNSAAAEYHRLNPLEVPYTYSGINLYVAVNAYADLTSLSPITTPPDDLATPIPDLETVTAVAATGVPGTLTFSMDLTSAPPAGKYQYLMVLLTPAWTRDARLPRRSDFAMRDTALGVANVLQYAAADGGSPVGAIPMVNATKPMVAGDVVWVHLIPLSNDFVPAASPVVFSTVVTAT